MATGHLLQNLVKQQTAIESLTVLMGKLRADVDKLIDLTSANANLPGKQNKPR